MAKRIHTTLTGMNMRSKLQSAMEYLMTYGWAILVIAVVLGVLYSLGIFSPSNFAPKATPGSCQVFRPNGPGTSYDANLEGTCSGELPQYVAQFSGCGAGCSNSYINVGNSLALNNMQQGITVTAWINVANGFFEAKASDHFPIVSKQASGNTAGYLFFVQSGNKYLSMVTDSNGGFSVAYAGSPLSEGQWYFVAFSGSSSGSTFYINDNAVTTQGTFNSLALSTTANLIVGESYSQSGDWGSDASGNIANVQIYNTTLNSVSINALYAEGIGGAPVNLQQLVGWWPLNGNANDYSGNGNDGAPTRVGYIGTWQSGYTPP